RFRNKCKATLFCISTPKRTRPGDYLLRSFVISFTLGMNDILTSGKNCGTFFQKQQAREGAELRTRAREELWQRQWPPDRPAIAEHPRRGDSRGAVQSPSNASP